MKHLIFITIFLTIFIYATDVQAGTIFRPVHHVGLVGYWDFGEGAGGTANDKSGETNHGTLTNMNDSDWVDGKIGTALNFDGDSDYVLLPDNSVVSSVNDFTVSAWINTNTVTSWDTIVGFGSFW